MLQVAVQSYVLTRVLNDSAEEARDRFIDDQGSAIVLDVAAKLKLIPTPKLGSKIWISQFMNSHCERLMVHISLGGTSWNIVVWFVRIERV